MCIRDRDLPLRALEYLLAMTHDEGVSATAVIAERLQVSPTSLTSYRRLLIQRQVIEQTARCLLYTSRCV